MTRRDPSKPPGPSRIRWTNDEIQFLNMHEEASDEWIAEQIGKGVTGVAAKRQRIRKERGQTKPGAQRWTLDEIRFILSHQEWKATRVAEHLGRTPTAIRTRRKELRKAGFPVVFQCGGIFSPSKADDPNFAGGRILLARTCIECGLLRNGYRFLIGNRSERKYSLTCGICRLAKDKESANKRHNGDDGRRRNHAAEAWKRMNESPEALFAKSKATRSGYEYTSADHEVLSRTDLTIFEKAIRLNRTMKGVASACGVFGYKHSDPEYINSLGEWVIETPVTDLSVRKQASEAIQKVFGIAVPPEEWEWGQEA